MSHSLRGKTAIVTGASRGIGLAISRALAKAGVRLGLLSRTRPKLRGKFFFRPCDLAEFDTVPAAMQSLREQLGTVDYLINNAGVFLEKAVDGTSLADWERVIRVNLTASFLTCRELLPHMIKRGQGTIINVASTAGVQGYLNQSAYCASKHGLLGFGRGLAIEAKPYGIRVHTLCPGGVDTELIKGTYLAERLKGQQMIQPEDIAEMVVFILKQPKNVDLPEIIVRRF
jgi:3-oxoacyl-[acyl-carrier protein] reductase